jgi:hypothetical protein
MKSDMTLTASGSDLSEGVVHFIKSSKNFVKFGALSTVQNMVILTCTEFCCAQGATEFYEYLLIAQSESAGMASSKTEKDDLQALL